MRVILHAVAHDVGDLDEPAVVVVMQRPKDAPLHRFEAVFQVGNRPVTDDVGGVFEEALVHAAVQGQFDLLGREGAVGDLRCGLSDNVRAAVGRGGFFLRGLAFDGRGCLRRLLL